jgi:TonB-dependent receptor
MVSHKNHAPYPFSQHPVKFKKSLLAMCVMALSAPALAQQPEADAETGPVEEIVVSGVRTNLQNAQNIKRNADTFVDSISASDIGSLPDRSVLEAMQRLPGISIERFAGVDDPDHFSVEGSGAVIRGMTATRSEFNGRDSFTANSGRGLSFQDVPPELMGGVDVYKNQSADMIEGGIGGTVSLRTRKPFDAPDRVIAFSGDVSYGDMAEEATPTLSALYSDRWETGAGEMGILFNIAHSELKGTSHGIQSDAYVQYDASVLPGAEAFVGDGTGKVWMPNGSNATMKFDDRERKGYAAAFQWETPDQTLVSTFQFMRSDATLAWTENALKYQNGYYDPGAEVDKRFTRPLDGTEFTFDDEGIFLAGVMADSEGWRSADGNQDHIPRSYEGANVALFGHKFQTDTRYKRTNTLVDDYALNFKWTPDETWEFELDLQYIEAETVDDDLVIHLGINALQDYDTRGDTPTLTLIEPWNGLRDNNPDDFATGFPGFSGDPAGDSNYFQDPNSYWWRSAMDHYERSEGDSVASRFDVTYNIDDDGGMLKAVKAGIRFAEREQVVRNTAWNWGSLGPEFSGSAPAMWLTDPAAADQEYVFVDWSDFHRGDSMTIPGGGLLHASEDLVKQVLFENRALAKTAGGEWVPYPSRGDVVPGTQFAPSEIYTTTETNEAAYIRLDFGSDETAIRFSGNIGLRYVNFERDALGSIEFPDLVSEFPVPDGLPSSLTPEIVAAYAQPFIDNGTYDDLADFYEDDDNNWASHDRNYLSAEEQGYGNNAFTLQSAIDKYSATLPSFNLKVELTDDLIARFAASKAIALPDMGDVRNQSRLSATSVEGIYPVIDPDNPPAEGEPRFIEGAYVSGWEGSGGNPYLQPMESTQFDVSLEWYFAEVGSLTGTVFYKDLSNFFIYGAFPQTFTNPVSGVTETVDVTGTRNGGEGTMEGFEIAYQQFYDMLPAPWDGLGLQVNYTYIEASGVPNNEVSLDDADWVGGDNDTGARVSLDNVPLQGQSKETFNIVGMYDKNDWSVRLAYNWRSRYLLTTRDVISKYPLWNDDAGYLDGSVFYNINDNITVGMQFTNLANTQTKTIMILDGEGAEAGRSWFVNDRRAALIVRATF